MQAQYEQGYTVDASMETYEEADDAGAGAQYAGAQYAGATVDHPYDDSLDAPSQRAASTLEDDLDEVDFYVSQDMMVEAADLLRSLLARHPGHPLISAKLRDVEAQVGGYVADGFARGASEAHAEVDDGAIEEEAVAAEGGTQNIDVDELEEVDAELEMSDAHELLDEAELAPQRPSKQRPSVMLERPVEEGDAETHYDLGLAYKEMGLWDEAVKAFEKVMGNPAREVQCRLMIGLCRRDAGNLSEAVHSFKAALHARQCTDREKLSLTYEIGVTYEALGDAREALYYYEGVLKKDPTFLDVGDRVAALRSGGSGRNRAAAGGEDSADLAIDSLLQDDV
jgi:tetratricopeptide (TPR) repeat protein